MSRAAPTPRSPQKTARRIPCTWLIEREKNLLFAQREGSYIDYLDEALQRVEDGSFGTCRTCGGEIGRARLEAVPTAPQCIECKSKDDKAKD